MCRRQAVDSVLSGESGSGLCVVRPPGHHAEPDTPHGFCLFNNVAVAARHAITEHGLRRVLILDWDVHHGNGERGIGAWGVCQGATGPVENVCAHSGEGRKGEGQPQDVMTHRC